MTDSRQLVVHAQDVRHRLVLRGPGPRLHPPGRRQVHPPLDVLQQPPHRKRQRLRVAVRHQLRGVPDEFRHSADRGGDQRHTQPQRLLREQRPRLPPGRQHGDIRRGEQLGDVLTPADQPHRQALGDDPPLEGGAFAPLPRDDQQRLRIELTPHPRRVEQRPVPPPPLQRPDRHQQRPVDRAQFGPGLAVVQTYGPPRGRHGDGREPGVTGAAPPGPVDEFGGGGEDDGRRPHGPALHHPQHTAPGTVDMAPAVPGRDERCVGRAAGERERGAYGGLQAVRVDDVRPDAGVAEGGDGRGVAEARQGHEVGADPEVVVDAVEFGRGAHGHPHAPRHQPRGK